MLAGKKGGEGEETEKTGEIWWKEKGKEKKESYRDIGKENEKDRGKREETGEKKIQKIKEREGGVEREKHKNKDKKRDR